MKITHVVEIQNGALKHTDAGSQDRTPRPLIQFDEWAVAVGQAFKTSYQDTDCDLVSVAHYLYRAVDYYRTFPLSDGYLLLGLDSNNQPAVKFLSHGTAYDDSPDYMTLLQELGITEWNHVAPREDYTAQYDFSGTAPVSFGLVVASCPVEIDCNATAQRLNFVLDKPSADEQTPVWAVTLAYYNDKKLSSLRTELHTEALSANVISAMRSYLKTHHMRDFRDLVRLWPTLKRLTEKAQAYLSASELG